MTRMPAPSLRGGSLALLAAVLFGLSAPLVQHSGQGLGTFTTAALLYAGAAVIALMMRHPPERGAALRRSDFLRIAAMAGFGAGRTGSVFASAPFIGASLGVFALGSREGAWMLMLAGVVLHLFESHGHENEHEAIEHEHAHSHNDGHHLHTHADTPAGRHSHLHRHVPMRHVHPNVPDAHHLHSH